MGAHRARRGRGRAAELRITLWAGLLAGLLFFNALQLLGPASSVGLSPLPLVSHGETGRYMRGGPVRVIDGDTFDHGGERIRIADIDTPELSSDCGAEARLARKARGRLQTLLAAGPFELRRLGRDQDRYGRKLRIVLLNGRSVGDMLVAEGLARTWSGRREPWC